MILIRNYYVLLVWKIASAVAFGFDALAGNRRRSLRKLFLNKLMEP